MVRLFVYTRDGEVIPISYTKETQLQINAEKFPDVIFFDVEETQPRKKNTV